MLPFLMTVSPNPRFLYLPKCSVSPLSNPISRTVIPSRAGTSSPPIASLDENMLLLPLLSTHHQPLPTIPFRIRTYKKLARNPFRIRTSKTQHLKSFRIRTYEKTRGEGSIIVNKSRLWRLCEAFLYSTFDFRLSTFTSQPHSKGGPLNPIVVEHAKIPSSSGGDTVSTEAVAARRHAGTHLPVTWWKLEMPTSTWHLLLN